MSKIREELVAATKFAPQRGEDAKKVEIRLILAVQDLADPEWNALSEQAREFYQKAADAINLMGTAPDTAFPAYPDAVAAPAVRTRVAATPAPAPVAEPPAPDEGDEGQLLVGDAVTGKTKRGKEFSGVITVVDDNGFVLDNGEEYDFEKVDTIEVEPPQEAAAEGEAADDEIAVGDTVEIITLRDKIIVAVVEELQDDLIVYKDATGAVDDIAISRTKSVTLKHRPTAAPAPAPAAASRPVVRRGGAAPAAAPAASTTTAAPAPAGRRTRGGPDGKPSCGTRIQQLIAANPAISMADVAKTLAAEEIKAADATVDMQYKTLVGFIALLRENGKLK